MFFIMYRPDKSSVILIQYCVSKLNPESVMVEFVNPVP